MTVWVNETVRVETAMFDRLFRGWKRARELGRPVLVSLTERVPAVDPLAVFARGAAVAADRFFWEQPEEEFTLVGVGAAHTIAPDGRDRFSRVGAAWRDLLAGALIEDASGGAPGVGPLLLGGFAFDPERPVTPAWRAFPDALLVLPQLLLTATNGDHWLTVSAVLWPDSDPEAEASALARERAAVLDRTPEDCQPWRDQNGAVDRGPGDTAPGVRVPAVNGASLQPVEPEEVQSPAEWQARVGAAADAVRRRVLEKVVLAREIRIRAGAPLDVVGALHRLRASYPSCYVFAVGRGERVFLGATPERLVRLARGEVRATCLAGSTRRGATPEEDQRLAAALLASGKDQVEHAIVAQALTEGMRDLCDDVAAPAEPTLLSVSNVHHLYTPVTARLRDGATLLDLVARLHPTPAVGGWPREAALRFIREREGLDRGWYAAPVGWVDRDGDGEFAVALRSALVTGDEATLFAGCGVVGDSDPAQEYAESWLKFRPMLSALGGALR